MSLFWWVCAFVGLLPGGVGILLLALSFRLALALQLPLALLVFLVSLSVLVDGIKACVTPPT